MTVLAPGLPYIDAGRVRGRGREREREREREGDRLRGGERDKNRKSKNRGRERQQQVKSEQDREIKHVSRQVEDGEREVEIEDDRGRKRGVNKMLSCIQQDQSGQIR